MKLIIFLALISSSIIVSAQDSSRVFLKWKIGQGKPLVYRTTMDEIDTAYRNFSVSMDSFLMSSDMLKNKLAGAERFFSGENRAASMLMVLNYNDKGYIDIGLGVDPAAPKDENPKDSTVMMLKALRVMNGNVFLRGAVNENGSIQSFYVKNDQKNLIALFFELPNRPVAVGDSWPLSINFIAMDQNFRCDTSFKKNAATLMALENVGSDRIALLKYDIVEYISGDFINPLAGSPVKTTMRMSYKGLAEFSTVQGRWIAYSGIMSLAASGALNSHTTKHFLLQKK